MISVSLVLRRIEQLLRPHLDWLLAQSEYAFGADPHVTDGLWRALKEAERHITQELGKEYSTLDKVLRIRFWNRWGALIAEVFRVSPNDPKTAIPEGTFGIELDWIMDVRDPSIQGLGDDTQY